MGNLDPFREAGNPLFNDNKLKLGIFGSNCSNACAMTLAQTSFEPTWEKNVEIARILETGGFERLLRKQGTATFRQPGELYRREIDESAFVSKGVLDRRECGYSQQPGRCCSCRAA